METNEYTAQDRNVNVEYEKIELKVIESGENVPFTHTTEIDHTRIIGISQVFSNDKAVPNSRLKLSVEGQQIFPSGFESKLIHAGQEVPPDEKFLTYINREAHQVKVEGTFTDGGSLEPFEPYTANIYLRMLRNR